MKNRHLLDVAHSILFHVREFQNLIGGMQHSLRLLIIIIIYHGL